MTSGRTDPRSAESESLDQQRRTPIADDECSKALTAGGPRGESGYDDAPVALVVLDESGVIEECNRAALALLGCSWLEVRGQTLESMFSASSSDQVRALKASEWSWNQGARLELRDKKVVMLRGSRESSSGSVRYHVALLDQTDRVVLEAVEALERESTHVRNFASRIVQDFNDPMSIVQGRLELLIDLGIKDPKAIEAHLTVALRHARQVCASLRNLRHVAYAKEVSTSGCDLALACTDALAVMGSWRDRVDVEVPPEQFRVSGAQGFYGHVLGVLLRRVLAEVPRGIGLIVHAKKSGAWVQLSVQTQRSIPGSSGPSFEHVDLSIERALLGRLGADVAFAHCDGHLRIEFQLPAESRTRSRASPMDARMLLVGPEDTYRTMDGILEREGVLVEHVGTGDEAARVLSTTPVDHVAIHIQLEGNSSGMALARSVVERFPSLAGRVLLLSPIAPEVGSEGIVPVRLPLHRVTVLRALGRRAR